MRINKHWIIVLGTAITIIGIAAVALVITRSHQPSDTDVTNLPTQREIAISEIAMHSSATDCWTYIGGMVFDATKVVAANTKYTEYLVKACGTNGAPIFAVLKYSEQALERQTIIELREQLDAHQIGMLSI